MQGTLSRLSWLSFFFGSILLYSCQVESISNAPENETPIDSAPPNEAMPVDDDENTIGIVKKLVLQETPKWCRSDDLNQCSDVAAFMNNIEQANLHADTRFYNETSLLLSAERINKIKMHSSWKNNIERWNTIEQRLLALVAAESIREYEDWLAFQNDFMASTKHLEELWLSLDSFEIESFAFLKSEDTSIALAFNTETLSAMNQLPMLQQLDSDLYLAWQSVAASFYSQDDDAPSFTENEFYDALASHLVTESKIYLNGNQLYHQWLNESARAFILASLGNEVDDVLTLTEQRISLIEADAGNPRWGDSSETDYLSNDTLADTLLILQNLRAGEEAKTFINQQRLLIASPTPT